MVDYTWFDFVIIGIFLASILLGLARGFIKEIISVVALALAFLVAIKFTQPLAQLLNGSQGSQDVLAVITKFIGFNASVPLSEITYVLSFLVIFIGVYSTGEAINYYSSVYINVFPVLGLFERLLGAGLGFVRGYAFNIVLIFILQISPITASTAWTQSHFLAQLQPTAVWLQSQVAPSGMQS